MAEKDQSPTGPYHAGPGTPHEIGIMIGFMATFVLTMVIYWIAWQRKISLLPFVAFPFPIPP